MKPSYRKRFDTIAVFKLTKIDAENVRQLARRLGLTFSETLRRTTRVGTKFLSEVDFPGSGRNAKETR